MTRHICSALLALSVVALAPAALGVKIDLPPVRNLKQMGMEDLVQYVAQQPGMEYLISNETFATFGMDARGIDPDVLEDSALLTVSNMLNGQIINGIGNTILSPPA